MVRAAVVCTVVIVAATIARAQEPARSEGWVVIPVDDYRALRLKAFPPDRPPAPPPLDAAVTRIDYDLRVNGASASGEARLTVDVMKDGWVRVEIPQGLLVRAARLDGRPVPLIDEPAPHVLLAKTGRAVLALDVAVPLAVGPGSEAVTLPPSAAALTRLSLVVPRTGIDLAVSGGVLAERPQTQEAPWLAFGRTRHPLTATWRKRSEDVRGTQALKWRGSVTQMAALGEEASPVTATVRVEVVQGLATSLAVAVPDGVSVNHVSGALVADWDARPGTLRVNFLEPITSQASFTIAGEIRVAREGRITIPLIRLPDAERETGGVAAEVLGAGEIAGGEPHGLEAADPSDLGEPVAGRDSPSMVAYTFRPQAGTAPRNLVLSVARYTPEAVLVANVEEARYEVLMDEGGKTMVRARYAVRNNQRAFLALTLPPSATLWSALVSGRTLRPGMSASGALLIPLEKGISGGDTPSFPVEVTYVQRGAEWNEKGQTSLRLPAVDLPIARSGVVVHYSPRYRINPEPGVFRVENDRGPFTDALRRPPVSVPAAAPAAPVPQDERILQFSKTRTVTGPLPVTIPFPKLGPTVFLTSELTPELAAPSLGFSYKRESRW